MKILKHIIGKTKNKRINIYLLEDEKTQTKVFWVETKTLVDFKKRHILETKNSYTVETFVLLKDCFTIFLDNSEVKNKIILKELSEINQLKGTTDL